MIVALLVVAFLLLGAAAVATVWWTSRHGLLADRVRRRVVVTTKAGDTFAGILYTSDRDLCVLREASVIGDGGAKVGADGEVLIFRPDIAYIQCV